MKNRSTKLGNYSVVLRKAGFYSIHDDVSGETMHSVIDPIVESNLLYVGQSDLRSLLKKEDQAPLVIWDVGLGAASNAMAAIHEIEPLQRKFGVKRQIRMISFENDLDSIKLAIRNPFLFSYIDHPAPLSILEKGSWDNHDSGVQWRLFPGDFTKTFLQAPAPDIIYYDMYSLNTHKHLWSVELFKNIFDHCSCRKSRLITYTVSTMVRAALFAAGFYVCYGVGSGPKTETTIAFTSRDDAYAHPGLMGREWLARFERSPAKTDNALPQEEKDNIIQKVREHRQFAG